MVRWFECSQIFIYLAGGWYFNIYSWFYTGFLFRPKFSLRVPSEVMASAYKKFLASNNPPPAQITYKGGKGKGKVRTETGYYPRSTVVPVVVPVFWSSLPT